jgi:RHS repeat-associated protein
MTMSRRFFLASLIAGAIALPTPLLAAEICGNGLDDDADNLADEGCYPTLTTGVCESPLSCGQTGMISPSTGSLRYALPPDVNPKVPWGPGIGLRRFYTSQYNPGAGAPAWKKPLGDRWQHTYMTWVTKVPNSFDKVWHTSQGQDVYLTSAAGSYIPQPGFHVKSATENESESALTITLLTGEVLIYDLVTDGRLLQMWDAAGKSLSFTHDANNQISTVTDSQFKRRLSFAYTGGLLTSVQFQIKDAAGTWNTQHTTSYAYTSGALSSVTIGGQLAQQNTYTNGYLTRIADSANKPIANFTYDTAIAGAAVRADTTSGMIGVERNSTRATCSGKTAVYFNLGGTGTCNADTDCATGQMCGGKDGTLNSGRCFRGARCLTLTSPNEDLVTTVAPLAPTGQTCDGACLDVAQYIWNTSAGALDLAAIQDPAGNYETRAFNANGLPTKIVYGDTDSSPDSGGARTVYLFYGDTNFPGKVTEIRRKSELDPNSCTESITTGCARTIIAYNVNGKPASVSERGTTLNTSGLNALYQNDTEYTYDTNARLTQIALTHGSATDTTIFEYWSSTDPFKDGFLQNLKRPRDATGTLVTSTAQEYDFWGNPTTLVGPDKDDTNTSGTLTCLTFSAARGHLTSRREAMAGQTTCSTTNAADITTSFARDSALRLTQVTRPDGSCMFYEYGHTDATRPAHLLRTKRRDDCVAANAGDRQEYLYDAEGLVTEIQTYDASNVLTAKQPFSYFDSRKLEKIFNPVDTSKFTGFAYDSRGGIAQIDATGNLGKTVYHRDGVPGQDNRVTSVDRYKSTSLFDTWNLLYDWLGSQVNVEDDDHMSTQTVRDDLGRVVKLVTVDKAFPTLTVYDNANRVVLIDDRFGSGGPAGTHTFAYDRLGRLLTAEYAETCAAITPQPEIRQVYDTLVGSGVSCPVGMTCSRIGGRLAYVRAKLMCAASSAGDGTIDQETFYAYDDAGRVTREYIRDDTGRIADHVYTWTKSGELASMTTPSGAVIGSTFGSATSNSDTDRVTAIWRTNTSTAIANMITWYPYGPLKQYNQMNQISTKLQRTAISRNLAYRITNIAVENQTNGTDTFAVAIAEDAKGRVTKRDYSLAATGVQDSYFLYDDQDRVMCETTNLVSSCPTSGTNIKNSRTANAFTGAGDWLELLRPVPGSTGGLMNSFNPLGYGGTHRVTMVRQNDGTPQLGDTIFSYDAQGRRISDDNTSTLTNDARSYTYDSRGNVINVHGQYFTGSVWHDYDVASAFDAKNRRVMKTFKDASTNATAQWFFYYDAADRLTEVRHTPNTGSPSTFSAFQLFWLGDRLLLYWQTDLPAATTSRHYVATDESDRPIDMWSWPSSGSATRVWAINPSAWGFDTNVIGPSVFQPQLFAGQYRDPETASLSNNGTTVHRPGTAYNRFRTYDPLVGSYLQLDPRLASSWSSYVYVDSDPVGQMDPLGLEQWLDIGPDGKIWSCRDDLEPSLPVIIETDDGQNAVTWTNPMQCERIELPGDGGDDDPWDPPGDKGGGGTGTGGGDGGGGWIVIIGACLADPVACLGPMVGPEVPVGPSSDPSNEDPLDEEPDNDDYCRPKLHQCLEKFSTGYKPQPGRPGRPAGKPQKPRDTECRYCYRQCMFLGFWPEHNPKCKLGGAWGT